MINLPWPPQRSRKHGAGGEPRQSQARGRQICEHSICSADLVHIVPLRDGRVYGRAISGITESMRVRGLETAENLASVRAR